MLQCLAFLLAYRGTWLTFVSWPTSVTWRTIGVHVRQDRMTFFVSQTQPCLGRCHLMDFRNKKSTCTGQRRLIKDPELRIKCQRGLHTRMYFYIQK